MPPNLPPSPRELFDALQELNSCERESWLAAHGPKDATLRARVTHLLACHDRADDFLEHPLLTNAANLLEALESLSGKQGVQGEAVTETLIPSVTDRMIGRTIGRYTIHRLIAVGGMGAVYEAQQDRPRRPVALKLMRGGIASRSALRRFEYESQLLARLRHPGIAQVYDAGTHDDGHGEVPYFAMEYVPNARRLTDFAREEKLGTRQRLELFVLICDAVHHGHQKGIIHRDLKPSNILVDSSCQPKVIDFGVARSTDSDMALTTLQTSVGQLIGTLQYMSPEQCAADPHDLDTRSDVYALGVVLYELLCGKAPYDLQGVPMHRATCIIREQTPTRLSGINRTLRGDLETVVAKALEKDRKRRYQSAHDLGQDIRRFLNKEPISARPPSAVYLFRSFAKRNRAAVVGVAGIILALAAGLIVSTRLYLRSEDSLREADAAAKFLGGMIADVNPSHGNKDVTVREILDRASSSISEKFKDQPLVEAYLRQMIADSYVGLGVWDEAVKQFSAAEALRRRVLGAEHPDTLLAMTSLAEALGFQGKSAEAAELHRQTLEIKRRVLGDEHPDTISSRAGLAAMELQRGRYAEAEKGYRTIVEHYRRHLGAEHPFTLNTANELAEALTGQGKYAEADEMLQRTLEIRRRLHGEEHPNTLTTMHNVAHVMARLGRDREAQELFFKTLETRIRVLGEEHADTQDITNCMAWWLLTCKSEEFRDPRRALTLAEHTVELSARKNLYYLETLALAQYQTGDIERAVASHEAVLALMPAGLEPIDCELKQIVAKYLTELRGDSAVEPLVQVLHKKTDETGFDAQSRFRAVFERMMHLNEAGQEAGAIKEQD